MRQEKPDYCTECPLYETGIPVHPQTSHNYCGLALVGEMPGKMEVQMGSCFIGPSGKVLNASLELNSISRDDLYVANIIRCGMPQGVKPDPKVQATIAQHCKKLLYDDLEKIGTKVVCAIGAVPWEAMTGLKGINKYRGCVIPAGEGTVPWHTTGTLHPAGFLRVEATRVRADLFIDDLHKAYRLATGAQDLWDPIVEDPNDFDGVVSYLQEILSSNALFSCDVETDGIDAMTCNLLTIGIGTPISYPIPYHPNFPGFYTDAQWRKIGDLLKQLLTTGTPIFHNMPYDIPVLERHLDIDVTMNCHDTLLLHHATYPKNPHKLEQVASQFLCVEPWKSEFQASEADFDAISKILTKGGVAFISDDIVQEVRAEQADEFDDGKGYIIKSPDDLSEKEVGELLWYNGCDCIATYQLFDIMTKEAHELDVHKVYEADRRLVREAINWYYAGVGIDEEERKNLEVEYAKDIKKLIKELRKLCNLTPQKEVDKRLGELQVELEEEIQNQKNIRYMCAFCDYEAKSGPDQCKHIVKKHFAEASEIATDRKVKWQGIKNQKEQDAAVLAAVKGWLDDDLKAQQGVIKDVRKRVRETKKIPTTTTFNPASPIQLREVLRRRGITPMKLTKKSNELSTAKDSLWELRGDPFVDILFDYRQKAKLYSTYIVGLPNKLGPDGRLHPVWKLHSTPSGRFGTSPAIQNWPKSMRRIIIPDPGYVIIGADYAALELRIAALLAGEEDLIEAFLTNADIHARHAALFFPSVWPKVDAEWLAAADTDQERDKLVPRRGKLRGRGKNVTFGNLYGAQAKTLYEQIREKLEEVKTADEHEALRREVAAMKGVLDNTYQRMGEWRELMTAYAEGILHIRTALSGRIRKWPMGEVPLTEAANHPIQGLAADIMNAATFRLIDTLRSKGLYQQKAWIIMQIHDAIYLEVAEACAMEVADIIEKSMHTELTLESIVTGRDHTMIFPAEAEIGYNAKELMNKHKWEAEYAC